MSVSDSLCELDRDGYLWKVTHISGAEERETDERACGVYGARVLHRSARFGPVGAALHLLRIGG